MVWEAGLTELDPNPTEGSWNLHNIYTRPPHKNFKILCGCLFNWFELIWSFCVCACGEGPLHCNDFGIWKFVKMCHFTESDHTKLSSCRQFVAIKCVRGVFVALAGLIDLQMCSRIDMKIADSSILLLYGLYLPGIYCIFIAH